MTSRMPLLDLSPERAARVLVLATLDEAKQASARLPDGVDEEALHDFRVGLRRSRSLIKAYRPQLEDSLSGKQRRKLRDLASGTNSARDAEVQLEWLKDKGEQLKPGEQRALGWLTERLTRRRDEGYARIRGEVLEGFLAFEPRLRKRLSRYVASVDDTQRQRSFAEVCSDRIRKATDELADHLEEVEAVTDVEPAHEARIRAKQLRYLLEPLRETDVGERASALVKTLKGLQDVLGELHDAHVLADELAASLVDSATERARLQHARLYDAGLARGVPDVRPGLMAIDRLIRDRIQTLHDDLQTHWRGEPFARLRSELHAFAEALAARAAGHLEIERKYLLKALPELPAGTAVSIDQGWIPGSAIHERLRRSESDGKRKFLRTIKLGRGIERIELEDETSQEIFEKLWPLTEGKRVTKRRYKIPEGDFIWEIDSFTDRELFLAEVELPSVETEVQFPDWLRPFVVREVTDDPDYVNEHLAR